MLLLLLSLLMEDHGLLARMVLFLKESAHLGFKELLALRTSLSDMMVLSGL